MGDHTDSRRDLIGILINNARMSDLNERTSDLRESVEARLSDLRTHVNARFDEMWDTWRSDLRRVEEVLDARLRWKKR